jgi:hypothetical protein
MTRGRPPEDLLISSPDPRPPTPRIRIPAIQCASLFQALSAWVDVRAIGTFSA